MEKYPWAQNLSKLQRAFDKSETKNEQEVKSIYISLGGKIKDSFEPIKQPKSGANEDDGVTFGAESIPAPKKPKKK